MRKSTDNTCAWEQRKLGEVASSFEYGLNAAAKEFDGVNKYLRITDIDDSSRVFKDDDLTSPDTDLSTAGGYQLHDGEILFARTGASVGKSFIYRESDGLVYYAGFLIRAKVKPEYDSEFIFQNTLGASYEKYIQITSQRSGQPGVNAQEYAEYTFLVPDYTEQKKIGGFLRQIDNLITLHQCKQNHKKEALMSYTLTKYEKETVLLYNQSHDPITISTYDPGLRRRLREFAARYPEMCRRVDKQKYPDYAEYEIKKDRVSIRLLPPMSEEKRRVASEKAKAAGLGTKGNA